MKLTLTREQIPLARETVAWLRDNRVWPGIRLESLPGFAGWMSGQGDTKDAKWADALEAAITEAEGTQAPAGASDDERRLWLNTVAAYVSQGRGAGMACSEADEALARYRKAFGGES